MSHIYKPLRAVDSNGIYCNVTTRISKLGFAKGEEKGTLKMCFRAGPHLRLLEAGLGCSAAGRWACSLHLGSSGIPFLASPVTCPRAAEWDPKTQSLFCWRDGFIVL